MTTPHSPEALRTKLLHDPYTAKIAAELGIPIDEYVQQVLHFAQRPSVEPQLLVVEDEDLINQGHTLLDEKDMARFLVESVTEASPPQPTGFSQENKRRVQLSGEAASPTSSAPHANRSDLRAELNAHLLKGHIDRGDY